MFRVRRQVACEMFIKLFGWSQSVVSHVPKIIFEVFFPKVYNFSGATARRLTAWLLVSRVSREMANHQTGAMRGSCIHRLQS